MKKNLSEYNSRNLQSAKDIRFGIVVSEWNAEITESLYKGCCDTLISYGANPKNILVKYVPGSFELPMGAQLLAKYSKINAIICIGCVIKGETNHFEYISKAVAEGIMKVGLKCNLPVIFCVLTTDNLEQAKERAGLSSAGGGKCGNKGVEAAIAAIKMAGYKDRRQEAGGRRQEKK